jgi:hypothetical protein
MINLSGKIENKIADKRTVSLIHKKLREDKEDHNKEQILQIYSVQWIVDKKFFI